MREKSISVIIPAYNIEKYLSACLDSILAQDFDDFEVIIVDDGSTDQTGKIARKYQQDFNKIQIIHQKNSGLSSARNKGIEYARGEYLAFIDGDDVVSENFLSRMYENIKITSADIAVCGYFEFIEEPPEDKEPSFEPTSLSGEAATKKLLIRQENLDIIIWNKLYRKKLFKDIKFPVGKLHEDNLTTYKILASARSVAYIKDRLYYYRQHPGSIMAKQDLISRLKIKECAAREAIEYFKNDKELRLAAEIAQLLSYFAYLDNIAAGRIKDQELWQKTVKKIKASKKTYLKNPYLTKKLRLYLRLISVPAIYRLFRKIIHD